MKNKISIYLVIRVLLVLGMFLIGAYLYPMLPDLFPTHWNIEGQVDGQMHKSVGLWLIPGMCLAFLVLFPMLSKLDPKNKNYPKFKDSWEALQTVFIVYFGYIFAASVYFSMNPEQTSLMGNHVVFGIGALFVVIGNFMGKIRQNYFIGVKTPWALNDEEVWQKTQRVGGWTFVLGGIVFMFEGLIWVQILPVFAVVLTCIIFIPIVYSYLIAQRRQN